MYYTDLTTYAYHLTKPVRQILNVGWLDAEHAYPKGEAGAAFCDKLAKIIVGNSGFDAHFNRIRGVHPCNLCGEREVEVVHDGKSDLLGMSEILVPVEKDTFFAAPSLIYHYVTQHNYLPPQEFVDAVLAVDVSRPFLAEDVFDALLASR